MIGVVNANQATVYAAISVTYPTGSVCTCSYDGRTLRARGASGHFIFAVPSAGSWVVTITDGAKTASRTVVISDQGQVEGIVLNYNYYIYKAGDECVDLTGGWIADGFSVTSSSGGAIIGYAANKMSDRINIAGRGGGVTMLATANPINLDDFSTLEIDWQGLTKLATYNGTIALRMGKTKLLDMLALEFGNPSDRKISNLDVSQMSGDWYIGVTAVYTSQGHSGDVFSIQLL